MGVCREDLDGAYRHLSGGWDMHVAAAGDLAPWDGRPLSPARHENNIWVRRQEDGPWMFDIIFGGGDASGWRSRRNPTIWLPRANAVREADGIPYLTPKVPTPHEGEGRPAQGRHRRSGSHPDFASRGTSLAHRPPTTRPSLATA